MKKLKQPFINMKGILFQINTLLIRYINKTGEKNTIKWLFRAFLKLRHEQNMAVFQLSVCHLQNMESESCFNNPDNNSVAEVQKYKNKSLTKLIQCSETLNLESPFCYYLEEYISVLTRRKIKTFSNVFLIMFEKFKYREITKN